MDTRQETIKKIKSLLRIHRNGLTITDIAEQLRLNRNSTAKYLEILLISGDVNLNNFGPAKVYTYSQKMPVSAMLKFSADIILLIDNEMRVLDANENALSVLGTTREDLIGNLIETVRSPLIARLDIAHVFEEISLKGEVQREFSIPLRGEDHHYRIRLIPTVFDTTDEGITIIGEDITKQIRFEESLMISETRYRAIVQDLTYVICRWRPDGEITFVNELFSRFIGIPCKKGEGRSLFTSIVPEDLPLIMEKITRLQQGQPTVSTEIRLIDHDGTIRWYQWNIRGIYDHTGALVECQSVGRDINTEREQAQKIRESEERFHMITDHSPFPISIIDRTGNFLYVNSTFTRLFGYTRDDIPAEKDWFEKAFSGISEAERQEIMLSWRQNPAGSAPHDAGPAVFPVTCRDGTVRQITFFPTTLPTGEQFVMYEDLTPKKEAERLHMMLASIVNSSNDAPSLYRSLNNSLP
jgi:PAS domain S-box-containing protein